MERNNREHVTNLLDRGWQVEQDSREMRSPINFFEYVRKIGWQYLQNAEYLREDVEALAAARRKKYGEDSEIPYLRVPSALKWLDSCKQYLIDYDAKYAEECLRSERQSAGIFARIVAEDWSVDHDKNEYLRMTSDHRAEMRKIYEEYRSFRVQMLVDAEKELHAAQVLDAVEQALPDLNTSARDWAALGMPTFRLTHDQAAALCATRCSDVLADEQIPPFSTFGLLFESPICDGISPFVLVASVPNDAGFAFKVHIYTGPTDDGHWIPQRVGVSLSDLIDPDVEIYGWNAQQEAFFDTIGRVLIGLMLSLDRSGKGFGKEFRHQEH
ncbi:MAG TPA: hypothetical protein VLS45_01925, partial [Methylomicrobium sp.]|nr:hypothetical protein [Methylomicrobium sp.]